MAQTQTFKPLQNDNLLRCKYLKQGTVRNRVNRIAYRKRLKTAEQHDYNYVEKRFKYVPTRRLLLSPFVIIENR
jgi:hypothetical protein